MGTIAETEPEFSYVTVPTSVVAAEMFSLGCKYPWFYTEVNRIGPIIGHDCRCVSGVIDINRQDSG